MLKNLSTTYDCKSGGTPSGLAFIKKTKRVCHKSMTHPIYFLPIYFQTCYHPYLHRAYLLYVNMSVIRT